MTQVALGFRVKTGSAVAVMVSGPSSSPSVLDIRRIGLSDPAVPESRQPYHAVNDSQRDWEPNEKRTKERVEIVRRVTERSVGTLLDDYRKKGWIPQHAGIVTGSLIDPSTIRAPHIRAHAMEGLLFRSVVEGALRAHRISCFVFGEKTALREASKALRLEEAVLKRTLATLGSVVEGPWRAEEKLAALAGCVALSEK